MRKTKIVRNVSLFAAAVTAVILLSADIFDFVISDGMIRTLGILGLISLPLFVYSTVRLWFAKKNKNE